MLKQTHNDQFFFSVLLIFCVALSSQAAAATYTVDNKIIAYSTGDLLHAQETKTYKTHQHMDTRTNIHYSVGYSLKKLATTKKNMDDFIAGDSSIGQLQSSSVMAEKNGFSATYTVSFDIHGYKAKKMVKAYLVDGIFYAWTVQCIPSISKLTCQEAFDQGAGEFRVLNYITHSPQAAEVSFFCSDENKCKDLNRRIDQMSKKLLPVEISQLSEFLELQARECASFRTEKCKETELYNGELAVKYIYKMAYDKHVVKDYDSAYRLSLIAAEYSYPRAFHLLGVIKDPKFPGDTSKKDLKEAFDWYKKGADVGWHSSQLNLARFYQDGKLIPVDLNRYFELILRAAESGGVNAMYLVGEAYENGIGVPIDMAKALHFYEKAAAYGDAQSLYNAGVFYTKGRSVPVDFCKAVNYYIRAAENNYAPAQHNLAVRYLLGQCIEENEEKAIELLKLAAGQGYELSINQLKSMGVSP